MRVRMRVGVGSILWRDFADGTLSGRSYAGCFRAGRGVVVVTVPMFCVAMSGKAIDEITRQHNTPWNKNKPRMLEAKPKLPTTTTSFGLEISAMG